MKPITFTNLFTMGLLLLALSLKGQSITTNFTPASVTGAVGSTVSLELKVTNFTNIISVQFPIVYQNSVLQFVSADNFGLPGFSAANYNNLPGKINVSWFVDLGSNPNGITLPAGTTIMRLNFMVIANGTSPVNLASVAPGIEIINSNGDPVTVNYQSGGSVVTGGMGGPPPLMGFHIVVNGDEVGQGDQYCLPVTVNDFDTIVSMQYAMHWNPAILKFDSTRAYNLPFLNASNFGGNTSAGTLLMSWYDQNAVGVSRPDGATIYQVCFTAIGPVDSSTIVNIDGVGFPPGTGSAEAYNGAGNNIWNSQVGIADTVFIVDAAPDPNAPTFLADTVTVGVGGSTCVDISVLNFDSLLSAQFVLSYDATKVQYQSIQFGSNPLGLSLGANFNPQAGQIRFTWNDPAALGFNLPDNTVIYSVCFMAIGAAGTQSPVTFGSVTGFPVEVVQEPTGPVNPNLFHGRVIIEDSPLAAQFGTVTDVTCFGANNGAIQLNVTGGASPYTFAWSGPNGYTSTAQNISNLAPGNYSVTVTASGGATVTLGPQAITQPSGALVVSLTDTDNVQCLGDANGRATISVTGGTAPYTSFIWRNTSNQQQVSNVQNPTNLMAGSFNVTVTDTRGCTASLPIPAIITGPPSLMTVTAQKVDVVCHGASTGAINVIANGGWGSYTITWIPGTVSGFTPMNLPAGSYVPNVTDQGGCQVTLPTILITQPAQPIQYSNEIVAPLTCPTSGNGSISITPSGGNGAPFTVSWPGGQMGSTVNGLAGGNYAPTITDSKGCTQVFPAILVPAPPPFVITENITNQSGANPNGAIDMTVTGGTQPYEYLWSANANSAVTQDVSNLSAGTYTVTITDANNCEIVHTLEVELDNPLIGTSVVSTSPACANDGCIVVVMSTIAVPPFVFDWGSGTLTNVTEDTVSVCNLAPGTYTITVTDGNNNSLTLPAQNIVGLQPAVVSSMVNQPGCIGPDGIIVLTPVPANAPMGYVWNTGSTSSALINVDIGTYVVTVTNFSSGCKAEYVFELECPPAMPAANIKDGDCLNTPNGSIDFSFSGGNGPTYTYAWSGPNGFTASTQDISNILPGDYTVTVTDESNEAFTATYTVGSASQIDISNVNELSDHNGWQVSGVGVCDGAASVVVTGQIGNFSVLWSNGATGTSTANLCGGIYSVTVTDNLGCTAVWVDSLSSPAAIVGDGQGVSNYNGFNVSCDGECDGVARLFVSGGVMPYTVKWPSGPPDLINGPGQFSQASGLCGGDYAVTITDGNGVTAVQTVTLSEPDPLVFEFASVPPSSFSRCDGELLATVPGAVGTVEFVWTAANGSTGTGALADNLCSGEEVLYIVTDENGCQEIGIGTVPYPIDGCLRVRPVLTPGDQDGKNDFTLITCIESVQNAVQIFNRWGQCVWDVINYDNNENGPTVWKGTNKNGDPVPEGVYYYVIHWTDDQGEEHEEKGYINLIR